MRDQLDLALLENDVEMETDYNLMEWWVNPKNRIKKVRFENENASTSFVLSCCMLICLERKNVSQRNLQSELVYLKYELYF